jgi:copper homeostasis protein
MNDRPTLEVPVDSLESARHAVGVADRLEVCSDLHTEGWTPGFDLLREVVDLVGSGTTGVVALIRPRLGTSGTGREIGDFVLDDELLEASLADIESAADAGADSVAIGPLLPDGRIDRDACSTLVAQAHGRGLSVSFLRTIDLAPDRDEAIRTVAGIGAVRILTAGIHGWDTESTPLELRAEACAADVVLAGSIARELGRAPLGIVVGGGIRSTNASTFLSRAAHLHSSCRRGGRFDRAELLNLCTVIDSDRTSG